MTDRCVQQVEGTLRALSLCGVRNLSEVVTTHIVERENPRPDRDIVQLFQERSASLARVFERDHAGARIAFESFVSATSFAKCAALSR